MQPRAVNLRAKSAASFVYTSALSVALDGNECPVEDDETRVPPLKNTLCSRSAITMGVSLLQAEFGSGTTSFFVNWVC